jgi:hypothetical protein
VRLASFGAILIASALLVTLLGLNVSIMGLVYIPRGDLYRILELYGLILSLGLVYMALFAALESLIHFPRKLGLTKGD